MTPTHEREKALRRIEQTKTMDMVPASELRGWLARYVALAADLEAAERWAKAERAGRKIERTRADNAEEMLRRSEAQTTAAERKAKELGRLADDEGSRRMSAERELGKLRFKADPVPWRDRALAAERDLATAREALERELRFTHGEETKDRIRAALRSLGDVD